MARFVVAGRSPDGGSAAGHRAPPDAIGTGRGPRTIRGAADGERKIRRPDRGAGACGNGGGARSKSSPCREKISRGLSKTRTPQPAPSGKLEISSKAKKGRVPPHPIVVADAGARTNPASFDHSYFKPTTARFFVAALPALILERCRTRPIFQSASTLLVRNHQHERSMGCLSLTAILPARHGRGGQ